MDYTLTKLSQNGQVVIPSEVRRFTGVKPATQFLVLVYGKDNIVLKPLRKQEALEDVEMFEMIERSEQQFKNGQYVEVDADLSPEEMLEAIMN